MVMPTTCAQTATRLVVQPDNMSLIKKKFRVPQEYEGCHTTIIDGYVIEGHVPATIVSKLLKERPPIRGISLPGMPDGSPGIRKALGRSPLSVGIGLSRSSSVF
jgi:hypothetical protein